MDLEQQPLNHYLRSRYGSSYISSNEELVEKYSSISNINLVIFVYNFFNYTKQNLDKFDYYFEKARIQNVLNKVESAFDTSENIFVGQVIFNKDELDILYKYANIVLKNASYNFSFALDEIKIIFTAIVNIAKDTSDDSNTLFDDIALKLNIDKENIPTFIENLRGTNTVFVIDKMDDSNSTHRYNRNTILAHAISPRDSIYKFLDVCLQIYIRDFNYSFIDNEQYTNLIERVITKIDSICQRWEVFDDPYLKRVLQCHAGIITLLPHRCAKREPLIQFMKKIFIFFNKINDEELVVNDYIDEIISDWSQGSGKQNTASIKSRVSTIVKHPVVESSVDEKPSPRFVLTDEGVEIIIPPFHVYDSGVELKCYITKNDEVIETIDISSSFGYLISTNCSSEQVEIPLDRIIGPEDESTNFGLRIKVGELFYEWPDKELNFKFLLFDFVSKKEIHIDGRTTLYPGNYFIYIPPYGDIPTHPSCKVYKSSTNVFYFGAAEGDSLFDTIYFINKSSQGTPVFVYDSESKLSFLKDDVSVPVSTVIPKVMIPCDQNPNGLFININDAKVGRRLSDIKTNETISDSYNLYNLDEIIGEIKEPKKISITNIEGRKLTSLYLIPNIEVRYDKGDEIYFASVDKTIKASLIYNGIVIEEQEKEITDATRIEFKYQGGKIIASSPQIFGFYIKGLEGYDGKFSVPLDKVFSKEELTNNFTISLYPQNALFDVYLNDKEISDARNDNTYKVGESLFAMLDFGVNLRVTYKDTEIVIMKFRISDIFDENPLIIDSSVRKIWWCPGGKVLENDNNPKNFCLRLFNPNNKCVLTKDLHTSENSKINLNTSVFPSGQYTLYLSTVGDFEYLVRCIYNHTFFLGSENERLFWKKHVALKSALLEDTEERVRFSPLIELYDINFLFAYSDGSGDIVYRANYVTVHYNVNYQLVSLHNTAKASVPFEALDMLLYANDKSLALELPGSSDTQFVIDNDTLELKIASPNGDNSNVSYVERFIYEVVEDNKK